MSDLTGGTATEVRAETPATAMELQLAARAAQRSLGRAERRTWRRARRSLLWRLRRPLYILGLLGLAGVTGGLAVLSRLQPPPELPLVQTSWICTAEVTADCGPDNAVAALAAEEDRQVVSFEQIPPVLVDAVIAAEDQDFFSHTGVDPSGIARALWVDLRNRGAAQGGSTITQQYVKNAYLTPDRTLVRKLREAVLAIKIERKFSKQEILERYLNRIYFGRGAYGVQAAAKAYFGKNVSELGLPEAAYLAGLIRSPETADASIDPAEADFRRESVLTAMVREGMITEAESAAALVPWAEPYLVPRRDRTGLDVRFGRECGMDYVVDWVRQLLLADYGPAIYTDGLRVYLSIDREAQCQAFRTLYQDMLSDPASDPDASLVALDRDRRVVALVGGRDYASSQVNLALGVDGGGSGRQAGSAFKPIVLASAIRDRGLSPMSRLPAPESVTIPGADDGKDWKVKGGAGPGGGYTLVAATAESSNTVYAQLITLVGPDNVAALAAEMGVTAPLQANPSLVLGAAEVSVLDMASVYATLANAGEYRPPRVIDRVQRPAPDGSDVPRPFPAGVQVLSPPQAGHVTAALEGVIRDGTGKRAAIDRPAAGKTGTTDDYRDAWFVGYSCDLTTAVWMGYSGRDGQDVRPMRDLRGEDEVGGGTFPADMWSAFMTARAPAEPAEDGCLGADRNYDGLEVLNPTLSITPTTVPTSTTASTTSTSIPSSPSSSTSLAGTPSSTSSVPPSTTSTTQQSIPEPPSSTTTEPASTTSTAAPPPQTSSPAGPAPPSGGQASGGPTERPDP